MYCRGSTNGLLRRGVIPQYMVESLVLVWCVCVDSGGYEGYEIMIWKVEHMARLQKSIGKFVPERCIVEAPDCSSALENGRRRLWDLGYETAGGTAEKDKE